jgi:hypothetical protein
MLLCGFTRNLAALGSIMWPPRARLGVYFRSPRTTGRAGWKYDLAESVETKHNVAAGASRW